MKPSRILLFFLSVFLILFGIWYVFPSEGLKVGAATLRFPCYEKYLSDLREGDQGVDVDSVLLAAGKAQEMLEASQDTLAFYKNYFRNDPNRIYLPDGDTRFFDSLFEEMEAAKDSGRTVRITHYGDSQLEMDRISSILRERLQEHFGGSGPGMVPMFQKVPTVSVSQKCSGSITRYARVSDSLTRYSSTHRYGVLSQQCTIHGSGQFTFVRSTNRYAQPLTSTITNVSVLLGHNGAGFSATFKGDGRAAVKKSIAAASDDVTLLNLSKGDTIRNGSIQFGGNAEIYGILLDGGPGVTVDNVAMRGCSGNVFDNMDSTVMSRCFSLIDTKMIILEFGGNAMPGISSKAGIARYIERMEHQFDYFRAVAPGAKLMFVGPADMCKGINGSMVSWPLLSEMNEALKKCCLSHGVAYWDVFHMMGGVGSMKNWVKHNPPLAGPDYIHFTTRGANAVGDALADSFLTYYSFYCLRKKLPAEAVNNYISELKDSINRESIIPQDAE